MRAVPSRLRPAHGPCPRRPSGRRQQGPRPSGLEPAGPCGTPSGISFGERRKRRSRFGDGKPLRRRAVRCRKLGCPAVPGFRREGAGRASANTFPARTASLPRVGEPADPGQRGLRKETAPGFQGEGRRPRGQRPQPGEAAAQAAMTPETSQRREACLALPLVRTGSFGTPPAPRKAPERSSARLASRRNAGAFSRRGGRRLVRPGPAGSLPSGRSAFSQRLIGHARPGIRARKLMKSPSAAANRVELDPALEASGPCSLFRGTSQRGVTFSAPGASLITAADSPIQPNFVAPHVVRTRCRCQRGSSTV